MPLDCPHCLVRVLPDADGRCPSCRLRPQDQPDEARRAELAALHRDRLARDALGEAWRAATFDRTTAAGEVRSAGGQLAVVALLSLAGLAVTTLLAFLLIEALTGACFQSFFSIFG